MSHVACRLVTFVGIACLVGAAWPSLHAAEIARLSPDTWDQYAVQGKEADCIYGDLVLRNDQLVAVIANPVAGRNANMTVKSVSGAIIDLTQLERQNDQLSAYYPGGGRYNFTDPKTLKITIDGESKELGETGKVAGKTVTIELTSAKDRKAKQPSPEVTLRYTLVDGEPFVRVETIHRNTSDKPLVETLHDAIRADKVFRFGTDDRLFESSPVAKAPHNVFWASDEWFGQSYGVICEGRQVHLAKQSTTQLEILKDGEEKVTIAPGGEVAVSRKIFPGATLFESAPSHRSWPDRPRGQSRFGLRIPMDRWRTRWWRSTKSGPRPTKTCRQTKTPSRQRAVLPPFRRSKRHIPRRAMALAEPTTRATFMRACRLANGR